jgi:hypothetical protein
MNSQIQPTNGHSTAINCRLLVSKTIRGGVKSQMEGEEQFHAEPPTWKEA